MDDLNKKLCWCYVDKEGLDKVVDYNKCKDIYTLPEARYASTHARVNNHRLINLPLCGVIFEETNRG